MSMSMGDESFASALDIVSPAPAGNLPVNAAKRARVSDPFVVRSATTHGAASAFASASAAGFPGHHGAPVPGFKLTRSSDQMGSREMEMVEVDDELALSDDGTETELDVSQDLGREIADEVSCLHSQLGEWGAELIPQKSPVQTALPGRPATSALIDPLPKSSTSRSKRASTVESEDILGRSFDTSHISAVSADAQSDSDLSEADPSEEEEEEEEIETIEGEEDIDTGDQADQDSSFASSIDIHADGDSTASSFEVPSSDDDEEDEEEDIKPVRRASRARRTTGSPRKRSPAKKVAAAAAAAPSTPAGKKGPAVGKKASPAAKGTGRGKKSLAKEEVELATPGSVLSERAGQNGDEDGEDQESEDDVMVTKPKKKRSVQSYPQGL